MTLILNQVDFKEENGVFKYLYELEDSQKYPELNVYFNHYQDWLNLNFIVGKLERLYNLKFEIQ